MGDFLPRNQSYVSTDSGGYEMNSLTSAEVKGWSIGLVTAIVDGESQLSTEVMKYVL